MKGDYVKLLESSLLTEGFVPTEMTPKEMFDKLEKKELKYAEPLLAVKITGDNLEAYKFKGNSFFVKADPKNVTHIVKDNGYIRAIIDKSGWVYINRNKKGIKV